MAGHYIPSMIDFIMRRNDGAMSAEESSQLPSMRIKIPVNGAAIGNGWTDPYYQYSAADAAYAAGIIDMSQRFSLEESELECQAALKSGIFDSDICDDLLDDIIEESGGNDGRSVNIYDTRLWFNGKEMKEFPPGKKDVETYLGGASSHSHPPLIVDYLQVLNAIHALESVDANQVYMECAEDPYDALEHQDGLGVVQEVVRILDHPSKPQILFYNGMNDLVCNHAGNERFLNALPWSKTENYIMEARHAWDSEVDPSTKVNYVPGRPDGYVKQYDNLTFLKILEAGHMLPMDQPSISLAMMKTFLRRTDGSSNGFLTHRQGLDNKDPKTDVPMCLLDNCPDCVPTVASIGVAPLIQEYSSWKSELSHFSFGSIAILAAAFVSGILLSLIYARWQRLRKYSQGLVPVTSSDSMEILGAEVRHLEIS